MSHIIFRACLLVAILSCTHSMHTKAIAKRNICNGNTCSACDGRSCNSCNDNVCCSSVSCNSCVNQCSNNCNTVSCKNNCVSGCTTACQENNNCVASSCSQCVNNCCSQCSSSNCVNNCSKSCDCTTTNVNNNDSVILIPSSEASKVIVNNTNNNIVNLTTHINIDNVIHNFNNISIPVYVNTTNINNINLSENHQSNVTDVISNPVIRPPLPNVPFPMPYPVIPQSAFQYIQSAPISSNQQNNCCHVLHPRTCYTNEVGDRRCYIRRTQECSDACTSQVISIEEGGTSTGCQRVSTWPYYYCGNYVRRDCNDCYTCGGSYNPGLCFRQSGCSDGCRRAAPSCVPSQSGLQCY